jgi:hypothetical protein
MPSRSLGVLTLDLVARIGGFEQGMDKAGRLSAKRVKEIEASARKFGAAAGTAFVAAATGLAIFVDAQAEAISAFQDLAEKTGDSAENIASLKRAVDVSGVSFETVAAASIKLTAALSKTDDESKGAGAAIKALGLNFDDFKKLSPVEQIDAVAQALNGFEDGANKTAVAVALFGKSGAELLPFLNDLADGSERQKNLTKEQIQVADEYTKAVARSKSEISSLSQRYASDVIPVLLDGIQVVRDLTTGFSDLGGAGDSLALHHEIRDWAQGAAIALATVAESSLGLLKALRAVGGSFQAVFADIKLAVEFFNRGGLAGLASEENRVALSKALEKRNKTVAEANERYVDLWNYNGTALSDALKKQFAQSNAMAGFDREKTKPKPKLNYSGAGENKDKSLDDSDREKIFGEGIEHFKDQLKEEADLLDERKRQWSQAEYDITQAISDEEEERKRIRAASLQYQTDIQLQTIGVLQQGVDALASMQGQSKEFQIGILLAQEALAAASIFISTQVAAARALAELGPIAGAPVAVTIEGLGLASIGIVAAKAAIGVAQISGSKRYGGAFGPDSAWEIAEPGNPELVKMGNKTILVTGSQPGIVEPATRAAPAGMIGPNAARTPTVINRAPGVDLSWMNGIMYVDMQEPLLRVAVGRSQAATQRDFRENGGISRTASAGMGQRHRPRFSGSPV